MNEQIAALHDLQVHDRKMVALERRLAEIPRRVEEMDNDLGVLEGMVTQERGKLDETQAFLKVQENRLEDEEEQIKTSKARLSAVKTTRELNAAQREIDATRRLSNARASEISNINEAITEASGRVDNMQSGLDSLKGEFDVERNKLKAESVKLGEMLNGDAGGRDKLVKCVELSLRRTYERIRRRAGGVAFVPVRERRCGACRMNVPHSKYVELKKGTEIIGCESCGRLMYWQGHFPKEAQRVEAKLRSREQKEIESAVTETA